MYCRYCGTKNPDSAKFCNNCGRSMTDNSGQQTSSNRRRGGGFFRRLLVSMVVFAVFYVGSYAVTTLSEKDRTESSRNEPVSPVTIAQQEVAVAPVQQDSGYIANLDGYWEEVKLQDGSFNLSVSALTFREKIYNCTGFTVNMDVTMNAGTNCKDWQVWGRNGGRFVRLAKIHLPAGDGYVSQSVTFADPVSFDSIAVTPTIVGSYSWSMSLGISDVYTK